MTLLGTVLAIGLALVFGAVGAMQVAGEPAQTHEFERFGLSPAARVLTGLVQCIAALLLLVGLAESGFAVAGAALLIVVMAGALVTHVRVGDPPPRLVPAALLLTAALGVIAAA